MEQNLLSKSFRRFVFITSAVLLFVISGTQTVLAQSQGEIKLSAQAGFDGYCKENRWFPVKVTVENSGVDVQAQIQITNSDDPENIPITSAEISLPGTSRKEFFISMYPQTYFRGLKVRMIAGGKALAESTLKITCLGSDGLLIGLLTDSPSSYDDLRLTTPLSGTVKIAQIRLEDLPDLAIGWAALDALVISGVDTSALGSAQRQALELWVADGGKLFVTGGIKWQGTAAGLGELLPVELYGTKKVSSLESLSQYFKVNSSIDGEATLAAGTLRPQAYLLVEQDGIPLLAQKTIGFGSVYFFAADPAMQPLSRWDGMRAVYEFSLTRKSFNLWDTVWNAEAANQALAVLPALGLPSIFASCALILVYLLVIGPLNYLFLRRIKRMELAWVSIPVLVIAFTLVTYVAGSISRGMRPIVSRMGVVFSWDGVGQSQVRGLVGVYSPNRAKYNLEVKSPFVALSLDGSGTDFSSLQQGTGLLIPDLAVEIGGMKTLGLDGSQPSLALAHDLSFHSTVSGFVLEGSITNTTPYTIEKATLHLPSVGEDLGDFAPGETKKIKSTIFDTTSRLNSIFSNSNYDPYSLYNNNTNDDTSYRRTLFTQALSHKRPSQMDWGVYVMGWVKNESIPVSLRGKQFDALDTSLVLIRVNPSWAIQSDSITIPNSFMYRETSSDIDLSYDSTILIPAGGYFLRFWPAIPIQFSSVKTLVLHQDIDTPSYTTLVISVWNYESNQWDQIDDLSRNEIRLPNPEQYVGPGGELRLKLDGNNQEYVSLRRLDFELMVNR